jgi:hypothetical protein
MNLCLTANGKFKSSSEQVGLSFIDLFLWFKHIIYQFINGSLSFGEVFPYRVKPIDIFDGVVFFLADFRPDMQTWVVIIGNEVVDKFLLCRKDTRLR